MRPVPTWKSTAAAPTPTSDGPYWVPSAATTPSALRPWQDAQPTRKSSRPWLTRAWSEACSSEAEAGDSTAYAPPVNNRPISSTTTPARGLRRLAESRALRNRTKCPRLLDQVDGREQADPDDIDEVPVVGHDDGAHSLLVGELAGHERAAQDKQEGDQTTGDVEPVEAGGEIEHRAVRGRGDGHTLVHQLGVLQRLAADEDRAHDVGEHEPLAQAPALHVEDAARAAH